MSKANDNLDTQTRYIWLILGRKNSPLKEDFDVYYKRLEQWAKINCQLYAFIGHDKDIEEDTNETKFRHIHALLILKEGVQPRLNTTLKRISEVTKVNVIDIDIERAENYEECIRYCLHRGYPLKHQYLVEELQTNLTSKELEPILNTEENYFTAQYLIKLITICNLSVIKVIETIGLKKYMKFRPIIKDIIEELNKV